MKIKLRFLILIITLVCASSVFSESTNDNKLSIDSFLNAETAEARNMLSGFSDGVLESYADEYKSALKPGEARKLWLVEESYKRKADKIAADRLFYVFLAVALLMILIFALTLRIYQMQKKLENLE